MGFINGVGDNQARRGRLLFWAGPPRGDTSVCFTSIRRQRYTTGVDRYRLRAGVREMGATRTPRGSLENAGEYSVKELAVNS